MTLEPALRAEDEGALPGDSPVGPLRLAPGQFFGGARLWHACRGIEVSHRIAEGPPESVQVHTHADAHFILVRAGTYVTLAEGLPAPQQPLLIYNPPGTTHRDHFARGRGSFCAISLAPGTAQRALAQLATPSSPVLLHAPAQRALVQRIVASCAGPAVALTLEALCLELIGSLELPAPPEATGAPHWLRAALELLHDCYAQELSVSDIAACVGVHPVHLSRTFRRHLRCTPGAFARYRRLERAADLLAGGDCSLAQIALLSGFADQSHLSKSFARFFGLPPGEYRALTGNGVRRGRLEIDKTRATPWARVLSEARTARAQLRRGR